MRALQVGLGSMRAGVTRREEIVGGNDRAAVLDGKEDSLEPSGAVMLREWDAHIPRPLVGVLVSFGVTPFDGDVRTVLPEYVDRMAAIEKEFVERRAAVREKFGIIRSGDDPRLEESLRDNDRVNKWKQLRVDVVVSGLRSDLYALQRKTKEEAGKPTGSDG